MTRVIFFTLNLLEEIQEAPAEIESEECRDVILTMLKTFEETGAPAETSQSVQYALTAWIDDVFSRAPWPRAAAWNAHSLEEEIFGTTCRHWRFFEQAEAALRRHDWVALSVFQFCVKFGFRGIYAKNRVKVQLNDRLPMSRARYESPQPIPILAGVLREEFRGGSSPVDGELGSVASLAAEGFKPLDRSPSLPGSGPVLPPTLAEWCQTTFWALGGRKDSLPDLASGFSLFGHALPGKRVLTEWAIVMAIGVLLSAMLFAIGH